MRNKRGVNELVLHLNTKIHVPNFEYLIETMNHIGQTRGVPISVSKLKALVNKAKEEEQRDTDELIRTLSQKIDMSKYRSIDFGSKLRTQNHIVRLLCAYYGKPTKYFEVAVGKNGSEQYKTSRGHVDIFKDNLIKEGKDTVIIDLWDSIKLNQYMISSSKSLYTSLARYLNKGGEIKDDIFYAQCTFHFGETNRITSKEPNLQGMMSEFKELITAPPGYKIAKLDISGQEVHILLFGILRNAILHQNWREIGDPYYAVAKTVNLPQTEELREKIKVPVLGLMNGMGRPRLLSSVKDQVVVDAMINLIEKDEGFKDTIQSYVDAQTPLKKKYRLGLFGTQTPTNRFSDSSEKNQLRNGFFQLTAAEIVALSLQSMFIELYEWDKTLNKLQFLLPIYDEFVFMFKEEYEEKALDIIERNVKPIVDDWPRFRGKIHVGQSYTP